MTVEDNNVDANEEEEGGGGDKFVVIASFPSFVSIFVLVSSVIFLCFYLFVYFKIYMKNDYYLKEYEVREDC